ncbi:MAG: DNA replication and repair protein RecF [Chloroflexi bacterium]|nr:DNA replication and repair protein RecF [Chloroflexota bacterium]
MFIKSIEVHNFRSFRKLNIELGNLSVLIGPNASGKSNFVEILRFLKNISAHGLANAVSMQGGMEFLKNINAKESDEVFFKITYYQGGPTLTHKPTSMTISEHRVIHEFSIKPNNDYVIGTEKIVKEYLCKNGEEVKTGRSSLTKIGDEYVPKFDFPEKFQFIVDDPDLGNLKWPLIEDKILKVLSLEGRLALVGINLEDLTVYDLNSNIHKQSMSITGKKDLEEDGSNLAIVLKNILEDEKKRRKFINLVQYLLPFVQELKIERSIDKSLLLSLREIYNEDIFLPSHLLSDGTIAITALLISLYFEKNKLCVFEEPFRNIHPALISKVSNMLEEASTEKQIIVTTHNPQMVKHTKLENLLLISRNEQGESIISRPTEREDIKIFLENEIGLDDLFVQGLLEN